MQLRRTKLPAAGYQLPAAGLDNYGSDRDPIRAP